MHSAVLRYLVAVARAGSIRKASDELHVAGSAVSRQIQKIEQELGMPLFERLPNGLRLTPAGQVAMKHAQETLHSFDLLKSELGQMKGQKTGLVRIACLDSLLVHLLPDRIAAFHRQHAGVDFRVQTGVHNRVATLVAEGDADIGITFNLAHPEDTRFIGDVPMPIMAMVAAGHRLAQEKAVTLSQCAQFNMLLQLDTEPIRSLIDMELSALDRLGRTIVRSNNLMMLKPLVLAGLGVAFYTPLGMAKELAEGSIVAIPLEGTRLGGMRMGLLIPRRRRLSAAAEAMVEMLQEALASFDLERRSSA